METYSSIDLNYTTLANFINWVSEELSKVLSSNDVNYYNDLNPITSEEENRIKEALVFAEAEVDSILAERYVVPVQNARSILIVRLHVYTIAAYNLYSKTGVDKSGYFKYKQSIETLQSYSMGKRQLFGEDLVSKTATFLGGTSWENPFTEKSII